MSKVVDERVVEMQFNNSQFEKNVATSLGTLDKLKSSLNFSGAADSFSEITSAADKVDFSSMSSSVESISSKFSALEVVAITALTNITNSAIEAGEQLISSLSVDQISAGWQKFSENTTNVGTLVSQGYDLEEVNEQMDRLLWYTDETSYNYTDMVNSISKFTASGQGLEESVTAMEGIANWAALSGQNAETASRAMYQLSQAMSSGYMRKIDYVSVQNANMDTQEFRQTCLDAAVALGTLRDNGDGTYTSIVEGASESTFTISQFADNLTEEAWLTSDVMMSVFETYGSAIDEIYEYAEKNGITASEAIEQMGDSVDEFGLKAFLAAQEARTWEDVVNSVKDAVSTGWMDTFTYIFGDYEEAKTLWTDLANAMYDVFMASSEARNSMLEEWSDLGGRTVLVDTFWQAWENVADVLGTVKEAFRDVFPHMTGEQLYSLTESLQTLVERLKMSDEQLEKLHTTFEGFFSILDIVWQAIKAVAGGVKDLVGFIAGLFDFNIGILDITSTIGDFIIQLDDAIEETGIFKTAVSKVVSFIEKIITTIIDLFKQARSGVKALIEYLQEKFDFPVLSTIHDKVVDFVERVKENFQTPGFNAFASVLEKIRDIFASVFDFLIAGIDKIKSAFSNLASLINGSGILNALQTLWQGIKTVLSAVISGLSDIVTRVGQALKNQDLEEAFTIIKSVLSSGVLVGIISLIKQLKEALTSGTKSGEGLAKSITNVLDSVAGCFKAWKSEINVKFIRQVAIAIAILSAALYVLAGLDGQSLGVAIAGITSLFGELVGSIALLNKIGKAKGGIQIIEIAAAILLLASAVKKLAQLDAASMAEGVAGVGVLLGELAGFLELYSLESINTSGMIKTMLSLIILVMAIKRLAKVVVSLAELSWEEMAEGLVGVGALMGELLGFMEVYKLESINTSGTLKGLAGLVSVARSIQILGNTVVVLAELDWEGLAKGITGVGALLLELDAFTQLVNNEVGMVSTGLGLIEIGASMKIFASAMGTFAEFNWEEIAKGLVSMGGALTEIAVATKLMPSNMFSTGLGLIEVALALKLMYGPLSNFSEMTWEEIAKGLVTLGGALTELAVALNFMSGTLSGSASLLVAAVALDAITPSLLILGQMSWESIAKSLITFAGALAVMGVAGAVLSPFATSILTVSAAMLVFAAAIDLLAVGVALIGAALEVLAVTGSAAAITLVEAIDIVAVGIVDIIDDVVECIGTLIVSICSVIVDSADAICEAVVAIIEAVINAIVEAAPSIVEGVLELVVTLLEMLTEYAPTIVDYLFDFIISIIEALTEKVPELIASIKELITALFQSVFEAFGDVTVEDVIKAITAIGMLAGLMAVLSAVAGLTGGALVGVLGMSAVVAEMAAMLAAFGALSEIPGFSYLIGEGGDLLQQVGTAIGKFIGGIVGGIVEGFTDELGQIGTDLSIFMQNVQPFLEGASQIDANMLDGVMRLVEVILALTATEILNSLTKWLTGGASLADFGDQIASFGPCMSDFAESVDGIDAAAVSEAAEAAKSLADFAKAIPNEGGLWSKIAGDNDDIVGFGKAMASFGPYLMKFADSVDGLDSEVVENACQAAIAVTDFAKAIPNEGGLWAKIAGDNTLSQFATELALFGPSFKAYVLSVQGITEESVEASNAAAESIIAFSKDIPNSGGLISWFTGNNDMGNFGLNLANFGLYFRQYYNYIKGIDDLVVTASAASAESLVILSSSLTDDVTERGLFGGSDIGNFGKNLKDFGTYFKDFYDEIYGINPYILTPIVEGLAGVVQALEEMPKSSSMETFCNDFKTLCETSSDLDTSGLEEFGENIDAFAPYIVSYAEQIKDIDSKAINASTDAASTLAAFAAGLPSYTDSNIDDWVGNMEGFGVELVTFGGYFVDYANEVAGITNLDAVNASTSAAESIAAFAKSLPSYSDTPLVDWFGTSGRMAGFGAELVDFGGSFSSYAEAMAGIENLDAVASTTEAAEALAAMANEIPESGGFLSKLFGDNGIDTFGENLESFGVSFAAYASKVSGITEESVSGSNAAIKLLISLASSLSDENISNLGDFSKDLKTFGDKFVDFVNTIKDISATSMDDLVTAITKLEEAISDFTGIDTSAIQQFFDVFLELLQTNVDALSTATDTAAQSISNSLQSIIDAFADETEVSTDILSVSFSAVLDDALLTVSNRSADFRSTAREVISAMAEGITSKESTIRSAIVTLLTAAVEEIGNANDDFKTAAEGSMDKVDTGFSNKEKTLKNTMSDIISNVVDKITDKDTDFKSAGEESITNIKNGYNVKASDAYSSMITIVSNVVTYAKGKYSDFYEAGQYLVQGFADGIVASNYVATSAATSMANAAKQAAQDALGENSPSKEFYSIGAYAGIGLANALTDYTSRVYSAGSDMGEEACEGLSSTLSTAADIISDEMDDDAFVITPVLNLDEIQNGMDLLYSMMDGVGIDASGSYAMASQAMVGFNELARTRAMRTANSFDDFDTSGSVNNSASQMINNTFNITNDDPNAVATRVSRIIQKQVERREASWGR